MGPKGKDSVLLKFTLRLHMAWNCSNVSNVAYIDCLPDSSHQASLLPNKCSPKNQLYHYPQYLREIVQVFPTTSCNDQGDCEDLFVG